jgi:hypothetical protein
MKIATFGLSKARQIASAIIAAGKDNYTQAKAELQNVSVSRAIRIRTYAEILGDKFAEVWKTRPRVAQPTHLVVRHRANYHLPMIFFSDGSLRYPNRPVRRRTIRKAQILANATGRAS